MIEKFEIHSFSLADSYLKSLLELKENRSMDVMHQRAKQFMPDKAIQSYFLERAERALSI